MSDTPYMNGLHHCFIKNATKLTKKLHKLSPFTKNFCYYTTHIQRKTLSLQHESDKMARNGTGHDGWDVSGKAAKPVRGVPCLNYVIFMNTAGKIA